MILVEGNGILHLDRVGRDRHPKPQGVQRCHELLIEVGDRAGKQGDGPGGTIADMDIQPVVDEVEVDLEDPAAEGDGRGGEPAGRDGEGDLPPFVEERDKLQLHLAHDLGPHVECVQ